MFICYVLSLLLSLCIYAHGCVCTHTRVQIFRYWPCFPQTTDSASQRGSHQLQVVPQQSVAPTAQTLEQQRLLHLLPWARTALCWQLSAGQLEGGLAVIGEELCPYPNCWLLTISSLLWWWSEQHLKLEGEQDPQLSGWWVTGPVLLMLQLPAKRLS